MIKSFSLKMGAVILTCVCSLALAEERVISEAERLATQPTNKSDGVNVLTLRGKVTEEQAEQQLKYMIIQGFGRVEQELKTRGSFKPIGLTISPKGQFRALNFADTSLSKEQRDDALVRMLKKVADSRSVWGVGLMYVTGNQRPDGTFNKRVAVVAEHIAGWAKSYSYPYKIDEDGEVRMADPIVVDMEPVYFKR